MGQDRDPTLTSLHSSDWPRPKIGAIRESKEEMVFINL